MAKIVLNAVVRSDVGKGASRRLRHQDKLPAIIYGPHKEPMSLVLEGKAIRKAEQQEIFYSQILTLQFANDNKEMVIVKDLQRHPVSEAIMHIDFQSIDPKNKITTNVPLHFVNEESAPGLKAGGAIAKYVTSINVRCLPSDLPEYIEIDMGNMQIGDTIHLSDLSLPENIEATELVRGHNQGIVGLLATRNSRTEDEESSEAEASAD